MSVVTRFAPSPTGFLHIGGARTALFNWLFARHHGGRYLLRIEDTDKERSTDAAIKAILDGLGWLGLAGDEAPVYQSERAERHRQVAEALLASGAAYPCYLTAEELSALREAARAEGKPLRSPWRDRKPQDAPDGAAPVIRLKMPESGQAEITDLIQGSVQMAHSQLDDLVLLRSDGSPTYMLAVVADDHDMGITHILRGDDHLNNAFRQQQIYRALDWPVPVFGHMPLIHGADGTKLSKRHGALGVDAWRDMGFLPEALLNYLARLGWSHGDDELFSLEQAISWFDGSQLGKAAARFDTDKLRAVNAHWMRQRAPADLADWVLQRAPASAPAARERLLGLVSLLAERAQTLEELAAAACWLLHDGAPQPDEGAAQLLDVPACARLKELAADLPDEFGDAETLQAWLQGWLAEKGLKMKDIGLPLRAVLTGSKSAPSLTDILIVLGKGETKNRIEQICN
jgi:glutamyl-tRNA synthetase